MTRMLACEGCQELKLKRCAGVGNGGFCTNRAEGKSVEFHPAVVDIQGPMSCEISALYEQPALWQARYDLEELPEF